MCEVQAPHAWRPILQGRTEPKSALDAQPNFRPIHSRLSEPEQTDRTSDAASSDPSREINAHLACDSPMRDKVLSGV